LIIATGEGVSCRVTKWRQRRASHEHRPPTLRRLLRLPCTIAVDIVNVFRRTEEVLPIAEQAVQIGAKCLWQQIGVKNMEADQRVRAAGLASVMNRCIKIEHARLVSGHP